MSKESKLMKNTAIIAIGQIGTKCISFFLLPLYTALLTTEQYGVIDTVNTIISLVVGIITLQLEQGVFRFLIDARNNRDEQKKIITSALFFDSLFLLGYIISMLIVSRFIRGGYIGYIIITVVINSYMTLFMFILRGLGNNVKYSIGSFACATITVILNVLFITILKWNIEGMLYSFLLANIVTCVYVFISGRLFSYIDIRSYSILHVKRLLSFSAPLIPSNLCWWIINVSDRLFINFFLGVASNGIYSVSNKFTTLYTTVTNIFVLSWNESAAENVNSDNRDVFYSNIMSKSFKFFSSSCLCIIALMPFAFKILVNVQYSDAYYIIPILMFGALVHTIINLYGSIYSALNNTKYIALTTGLAAIINVLINIFFIKSMGLYAAAYSTVIAYVFIAVLRHIKLKGIINIHYDIKTIISQVIMYLIVLISYYFGSLLCKIGVLIVCTIFTIISNKEIIVFIFNRALSKLNMKK